jgi:hypothetical protein
MTEAENGSGNAPATTERFYAGTIKKMFPGAGMGVVRSASGREIPFAAAHVQLVGPIRCFDDLREGMRVGFDVGWTSKGLRVTVLRAQPPEPSPA